MKKIISIIIIAVFVLTIFAACTRYVPFERYNPQQTTLYTLTEPPSNTTLSRETTPLPEITESPIVTEPPTPPTPPPALFNPSEDWEVALVEHLSQFTPIFRNGRFGQWGGWQSDWEDYVYWLVDREYGDWNLWYGEGFTFRDPETGERLIGYDMPFLLRDFIITCNEGSMVMGPSIFYIAINFYLYQLDETGVPTLIIRWIDPMQYGRGNGGMLAMYRFQNGAFEYILTLTSWEPSITFLKTENDNLFFSVYSVVASMRDIRLLNPIGAFLQVITTCGWYGTVTNHLTDSYWLDDERWRYPDGIEHIHCPEEYYSTLIGEPVTIIEPLNDLRNQLLIFISAQQNTTE